MAWEVGFRCGGEGCPRWGMGWTEVGNGVDGGWEWGFRMGEGCTRRGSRLCRSREWVGRMTGQASAPCGMGGPAGGEGCPNRGEAISAGWGGLAAGWESACQALEKGILRGGRGRPRPGKPRPRVAEEDF